MGATSAYDLSPSELLKCLEQAVAKSDENRKRFSAGLEEYDSDLEEIFYYRGAVLAALEMKRPPFQEGAEVRSKKEWGISIVFPLNAWDHCLGSQEKYIVHRMYYAEGRWLLSVENDATFKNCVCLCPADEFEAVVKDMQPA